MDHRFGMSLAEDKRGVLQDIQHPQEILTPADRNAHDRCPALIDSPPVLVPGARCSHRLELDRQTARQPGQEVVAQAGDVDEESDEEATGHRHNNDS